MPYTGLTAGDEATMSTRQRDERARILAEEDKLTRLDPLRAGRGQVFEAPHVVGNVRGRLEAQTTRERDDVETKQPSLAAELAHEAEMRATATLEQQRLQSEREQKERYAANEARGLRNQKVFNWKLALQQAGASDSEIAKVIAIADKKFPNAEPEKLVATLYTLREATSDSRPEWAAGF